MNWPAWYEIRLAEPLDEYWQQWFLDLGLATFKTTHPGTLLRGELRDPAALFGALARVRDLNLTLLEVRRIPRPPQKRATISPGGARFMPKPYDVITFSDMCVDLILTGADVTPQFGQVEKLIEDYTLELGGSCNIFACQAARLGLRTAAVGRVGADSFGELILRRLAECGVDTTHVQADPSRKTGLGVALCPPGDRAILTYLGTINAVFPADAGDEILGATRHLHHASYYLHTHLRPAAAEIFRRARRLGATTSLDTNWDPDETWGGDVEAVLAHTDVFLPNDQEALRISRRPDLPSAARHFLDLGVRVVVIKRGAQGAAAYTAQGCLEQGVTPVSGGDSIGAGDSFDAGFLAGWLRGLPLERCLAIAAACGRSVAAQVGGLAGQPRWEDVQPGG